MKIVEMLHEFFAPSEDDGYESEPQRDGKDTRSGASAPARSDVRETPPRIDRTDRTDRFDRGDRTDRGDAEQQSQRGKVVNIQATAQLQVVLVKPEVFTDAKQIADHLIAKKTVVLNLETASAENKRRIIDFLVGVAYANGGSLKPVANLTYIITPYNVGFIGEDLVSELETNGVIM